MAKKILNTGTLESAATTENTAADAAGNPATGLDRRQFLGNGMALGLGAGTLLANMGLSRYAAAQNATPAPAAGAPPARPPTSG